MHDFASGMRLILKGKRLGLKHLASRDSLGNWFFRRCGVAMSYDCQELLDSPTKWGPCVWRLLFCIANMYTASRRAAFGNILNSLCVLIPCRKCGDNFKALLQKGETAHRWKSVCAGAGCVSFVGWLHDSVKAHASMGEEEKIS